MREQLRTSEQLVALAYLVSKIIETANDMSEFIFPPDITEFALKKSIVNAYKNVLGNECKRASIRTPFPISNNVISLASLQSATLIRVELKHFSVNMRFLENYVQSDDFCFFSSRKRRRTSLPFL